MKSNELLRLLLQAGWFVHREAKGSHKVLRHPDRPEDQITFPNHGAKEVGKGLELKIKKQGGLK